MGWTGYPELDHVNNILNEELANVGATDAEVVKSSLTCLVEDQARRGYTIDPARCWYLAPAPDGTPYVGIILLDIDWESSREQKRTPGSVYVRNRDESAPHSDRYVQSWLTTYFALADGPNHRDYPDRFAPYAVK